MHNRNGKELGLMLTILLVWCSVKNFLFFKIFSTIAVPLSVCSRSTPRYLMKVFDVITLFPQEIANLECFDSIYLVPNRIDSVLPRWGDNILVGYQPIAERQQIVPQNVFNSLYVFS